MARGHGKIVQHCRELGQQVAVPEVGGWLAVGWQWNEEVVNHSATLALRALGLWRDRVSYTGTKIKTEIMSKQQTCSFHTGPVYHRQENLKKVKLDMLFCSTCSST